MEKIDAYRAIANIEGVISELNACTKPALAEYEINFRAVGELGANASELKAYILMNNDADVISRAQSIPISRIEALLDMGMIGGFNAPSINRCVSILREIAGMDAAPVEAEPTRTIPPELQTDKAIAILKKAIEVGLCTDKYEWLKGLQLAACFAQKVSDELDLGKGTNSDGTKRIAWKPFEILFNFKPGILRHNLNDIKQSGCEPSDISLLDKVL